MVWDTLVVPGLREHLIRKYVPKEPIDPLVYKVTVFYWLLQELVGNWKSGRRLTLDQKAKLLELLVWNFTRLQQEHNEYQPNNIVPPGIETFTEGCQSFGNPIESVVSHPIDVALCETSDEEEYETSISRETTEQIAQLVLACKEFQS